MLMPFPDPMREVLTACATIVYDPNVEKTDDGLNRNLAGKRTSDSRSSTASQWQCAGNHRELLRIRCSIEQGGPL